MVKYGVLFEVRTEFLNIIRASVSFKELKNKNNESFYFIGLNKYCGFVLHSQWLLSACSLALREEVTADVIENTHNPATTRLL
jgi:hypothetical protein